MKVIIKGKEFDKYYFYRNENLKDVQDACTMLYTLITNKDIKIHSWFVACGKKGDTLGSLDWEPVKFIPNSAKEYVNKFPNGRGVRTNCDFKGKSVLLTIYFDGCFGSPVATVSLRNEDTDNITELEKVIGLDELQAAE